MEKQGTTSAWQAREFQQEGLMESLSSEMVRAAEEFSEEDDGYTRFCLAAAHDFLIKLIAVNGGAYCQHSGNVLKEVSSVSAWVQKAIAEIDKFSRDPAEINHLKIRMMNILLREGTVQISSDYSELQVCRQKVLYNGKVAMDEVPIPQKKCSEQEHSRGWIQTTPTDFAA